MIYVPMGFLELEIQGLYGMDAGAKPLSPGRTTSILNCGPISPAPSPSGLRTYCECLCVYVEGWKLAVLVFAVFCIFTVIKRLT